MLRVAVALERLVSRFGVVAAWLTLPPLILVSVYDIVARRFYNAGSTKLQEGEWYLFFAFVMLTLGFAFVRDAHVRIDVVRGRLGPRARAWIELIGMLVVALPFCAVLIVYGSEMTWSAWVSDERSSAALGLGQRWLVKAALPVGCLLFALAATAAALRSLIVLRAR